MHSTINKCLTILRSMRLAAGVSLACLMVSTAAAQSPYFRQVQPLPPRLRLNEPFPAPAALRLQPLPPQYAQPLPPVRVSGVRPYGAWNTYGYGSSRYVRVYGGAGSNLPPAEIVVPAQRVIPVMP